MTAAKVIVGLGNPGSRYEKTRHNAGVIAAAEFANAIGAKMKGRSKTFEWAEGELQNQKVLIVHPLVFMNESGRAVSDALHQLGADIQSCLIVLDDVSLPLGRIRFRPYGSAGGHNGLDSVLKVVGTEEVHRLRIGVGPYQGPSEALAAFVLGSFSHSEEKALKEAVITAQRACEDWLKESPDAVMQRFNG